MLFRSVEYRVGDRRVMRLIRKWLKAGVAEDGVVKPGEVGTPQGAVISPLLANIYLHYVFDLWAQQWRQRQAHGDVIMVRYADDIVVGFEHQADAERFMAEMRERLAAFALTLHGEKTRLIRFGRFAALRQAGNVRLSWVHPHLRAQSERWLSAETEDTARPDASAVAGDPGGAAAPDAHDDRRTGRLAAAGDGRVLRLSCRTDQCRRPGGVPAPRDPPLAAHAAAARSEGQDNVAADRRAGRSLASQAEHHSPLAQHTLCRQTPKVGAVCGKPARTVLCGGRPVTGVPTAIVRVQALRAKRNLHSAPWPSTSSLFPPC